METSDEPVAANPWLSVWRRPRDTVKYVTKTGSNMSIWLLGAVSGIAVFLSGVLYLDAGDSLFNWRVFTGLLIAGTIYGVFVLLLSSFLYRWFGRLLGGQASFADVRAAVAWSAAPMAGGLAICVLGLGVLKLLTAAGQLNVQLPSDAGLYLYLGLFVLQVWALLFLIVMLSAVQKFGVLRALSSVALGFVAVATIAVLVRSLLYHPFKIPSRSMQPTLLVGDHLFVSKFSYGYSRNSLPFRWNLFSGRVLPHEPERGDVVVFKLPRDPSTDYINRVIGLPGDTIQMRDGILIINGQPVPKRRVDDFVTVDDGRPARIPRYEETLPNGVKYFVLDSETNGALDNTAVYNVPKQHYFMMGDHRDNSTDSRLLNNVGYIPHDNLVGRARWIFFSLDNHSVTKPMLGANTARTERFGLDVSP